MRTSHTLRVFLLMLLVALLLPSCALWKNKRTAPETETLPVAALYQKARAFMVDGSWSKAEKYFQRLTARFPFGPYSEQAQLDLAYVQYKGNKPDDAYSGINRFIKTYPAQKHIDYAYYLRGLINFNRSASVLDQFIDRDKSDRDPGFLQQSFNDFTDLVQRYPHSRYTADALQRMVYLRNALAQHELTVALYYVRRHACVGATERAQYVIEHYQTSPQTGDALAVLATCYARMGLAQQSADAVKVLKQNYPQHPYLADPKDWPDFPSTLRRLIPFSSHG
ncbi:MAG TPA: outer membrane protein assembly factor BamD [Rhodanobacteraceae bacterium]|nr:outer membrane protein assembly factor BamD [Rhodanobacteraceae bacterium]